MRPRSGRRSTRGWASSASGFPGLEIGYSLRVDATERGLATEAVLALECLALGPGAVARARAAAIIENSWATNRA
jgi:RimJ/RimL family protein N-acetyltransferase